RNYRFGREESLRAETEPHLISLIGGLEGPSADLYALIPLILQSDEVPILRNIDDSDGSLVGDHDLGLGAARIMVGRTASAVVRLGWRQRERTALSEYIEGRYRAARKRIHSSHHRPPFSGRMEFLVLLSSHGQRFQGRSPRRHLASQVRTVRLRIGSFIPPLCLGERRTLVLVLDRRLLALVLHHR
ncbi:hypothetical protein PENTCL1PPCAC_5371, partial [Pristionchus entomophagus]